MSELLAAIPRLFNMRRSLDYSRFVNAAHSQQLTDRALAATQRQMMDAYQTVIVNGTKEIRAAAPKN